MHRHFRALALVLAAGASAACIRTRTDPVTGRLDVDVESPTKRGEDWSGSVGGQGNFSGATGTIRAAVLQGQSTITLRVNGLPAGGMHAWRVYEGRCGTTGALFGSESIYPAITVNAQGLAEGVARVSMALDEAKKYHVRVYASSYDTSVVAACGNLGD